jgi:hypothetical protein
MRNKITHMVVTQQEEESVVVIFKAEGDAREFALESSTLGIKSVYFRQDLSKPPNPTTIYSPGKESKEYTMATN